MSDYNNLLLIQDNNPPSVVHFLPTDNIYNIDLNLRKIDSIKTVVIESDHKSRVLYFKVPRFFDNIDLAHMVCIIEYINAKKEEFVYIVPFFDLETFAETHEMCFYWEISQHAAKIKGTINFAMTFYKVNPNKKEILYKLNTLSHHFDIQPSIGFTVEDKRIEAQYVPFLGTEFNPEKKYYSKTITQSVNEDGTNKVDDTGNPIFIITYNEAKEKLNGITYYEKVDLYNNTVDNYFNILCEYAKEKGKQDLTWITLE